MSCGLRHTYNSYLNCSLPFFPFKHTLNKYRTSIWRNSKTYKLTKVSTKWGAETSKEEAHSLELGAGIYRQGKLEQIVLNIRRLLDLNVTSQPPLRPL